jgi:hypothetical protein
MLQALLPECRLCCSCAVQLLLTAGPAAAAWLHVASSQHACHAGGGSQHRTPSTARALITAAQLSGPCWLLWHCRVGDVAAVYALVAPSSRALTGSRPDRLRQLLQADARYAPLLEHYCSSSVRRVQHQGDTYLEIVAVTPEEEQGGVMGVQGAAVLSWIWIVGVVEAGLCLLTL